MITNPHVHTSQEIDNSSFDETLGVSMVEIIGADGVLKNPATEETLQEINTKISTEAKQDTQIVNQDTLLALIETLQELCRNMASLASTKGIAADLRVTPLVTPNMTTLGNITSIGGQPATGIVEDLGNTCAQFNIDNIVG